MFIFLTSAKNFRASRWIGSPALNRLGVYGARKRLAGWCADARRSLIGWGMSAGHKEALATQGYLALPNFLSQADFEQVRQELCDAALPFIEMCQPPALTHSANAMHSSGSFRTDAAGLQAMGYQDLFMAAVPGNTLVIADTSGFHRRTPSPAPTVRIEVYFTLRRNPFFAGLVPSVLGLPLLRIRLGQWQA
jgi:hypothetical protein